MSTKYDFDLLIPTESATDELADSVAKIALHNFEWRYITFIIYNSSLIIDGIGKFLKLYTKSQIIGKGIFYPSFAEKTRQVVVFGTDIQDISEMLNWMAMQQFDNTGKFIAVCQSVVPQDCNETVAIDMFWNYKITNLVFVKFEEGNVAGYTYFYSINCRNGKPVKIETLSNCNYVNKSSCIGFYPEKLKNLHRCPIIVSTFLQVPYMNITNGVPHGADGDLLLLIADGLNASLKMMLPRYGDGWGMLESNGQWSGSLRDILDDEANFSMTSAALTLSRFSSFAMSIAYYEVGIIWITHSARMKPSSLKIFQPFQILSLVTFLASFIFILMCGWFIQSKYGFLQKSQEEKNVMSKDLIFYSWMMCMGVPSTKLPGKPAFLYIVFLWIWYCFLVRTLYQVYLIGSLQGNFYYDQIESIKEAYVANYSFGGGGALKDYYIDNPLVYDNWKNVETRDIVPTLLNVAKGKNFVLAMNSETANTVILKQKLFVHIFKHKVVSSPTVLLFKKFSPLANSANTVLWRLVEAGFTDKIYKNHTRKPVLTKEQTLLPLNLEHYTGCYVILIVGWITSAFIFLMELVCKTMQEIVMWKYFCNFK